MWSLKTNFPVYFIYLFYILGGVIDSMHQPLVLQLMVLTPEDVSKVNNHSR